MARLCTLAINYSGAWKSLIRFDIDAVDNGTLLSAAETIAKAADGDRKPGLRIAIADGLATPLMHWTAHDGWKDWKS